MKLFRKFWYWIKGIFSSRKSFGEKFIAEQKIIMEVPFNQSSLVENYAKSTDESAKSMIVDQLAEHSTAQVILDIYQQNESFFRTASARSDLEKLKTELLELERKSFALSLTRNEIAQVEYVDLFRLDQSVNVMVAKQVNAASSKMVQKIVPSYQNIQSSEKLTTLLKNKGLRGIYSTRLEKVRKLNELERGRIKDKLNRLEGSIGQNRFFEANKLISELSMGIRPAFTKENLRLKLAQQKLRDKELAIIEKARQDILKKHSEEAYRQQEIERQRKQELGASRETSDTVRRPILEPITKDQSNLESLLSRKTDWIDFENICKTNSIDHLFHFTDRANLRSIRKHGGLFSWNYLDKNNIDITYPGGDLTSRDLDRMYNLQDFVRLSFTSGHPMMFVAKRDDRIKDPIVLKISPEVCLFRDTKFSDMNATKKGHSSGSKIDDFKRIRFEVFKNSNYFNLDDQQKSFYQAEVMVKTWIPAKFILNIDEF